VTPADPFAAMDDEQVLERAATALRKVQEHPVGSAARSMQWAVYEDAKAELDLRLCRHVLRKIRDRKQGE